jgi:hypothetical protein
MTFLGKFSMDFCVNLNFVAIIITQEKATQKLPFFAQVVVVPARF